MEIIIVMGVLFIFFTVVYIVLAIYAPEWVGITGKKAHEINQSHHSEEASDNKPDPSEAKHD